MDARADEPGSRSGPSVGRVAKTIALTSMAALAAAPAVSAVEVGPQAAATLPIASGETPVVPDTAIDTGAGDPVTVDGTSDVLASTKRGAVNAAAVSPSLIPAPALAAYQRAAVVINAADASCRMPWQLLAAIGRVESDHGRYGGSTLDTDGLARPGIFGPRLDGSHHTSRVADTDAGRLDTDKQFDRAVGPMQFIPSTWSVVGVDADGDDVRNPQDVDDAALAAAVYLCSGEGDLSTVAGQRSAVYRYNHSTRYVEVVLALTAAYQQGDFASVPTSSFARTDVTIPTALLDTHLLDTQHNPGSQTLAHEILGNHSIIDLLGPLHILIDVAGHQPGQAEQVSDTSSIQPGQHPTDDPTTDPGADPTTDSTTEPTAGPTVTPTGDPTDTSTTEPTATTSPSDTPTPTSTPTSTPTDTTSSTSTSEPTSSPSSTDSSTSSDPTLSSTSSYDPAVLQQAWQTCVDGGVPATDQIAMTSCMAGLLQLDPADQQLVDYVAAQATITP
ncbi:MAG TPA: lytic murein transglycosylase [Nocardioides sp.]